MNTEIIPYHADPLRLSRDKRAPTNSIFSLSSSLLLRRTPANRVSEFTAQFHRNGIRWRWLARNRDLGGNFQRLRVADSRR